MTSSASHGAKLVEKVVVLDDYQVIARQTDQKRETGLDGLSFLLLGLFGEVGTLLSALKKKQRDRESFVGYTDAIYGPQQQVFTLAICAMQTFRGQP